MIVKFFLIRSFYRGCDARIKVFEQSHHCQIEKNERTCFSACSSNLCNYGDGLSASSGATSLICIDRILFSLWNFLPRILILNIVAVLLLQL